MKTIAVSDLMPGLSLGSAVFLRNNPHAPYLTANRVITANDIKNLKENGIEEVEVYTSDIAYTFPDSFCESLQDVIAEFGKTNDIELIKKYAHSYEILATDELGRGLESFKINMDKYMLGDNANDNPHYNADEHIVNVVNMAVAIATVYNNTQYEKDRLPIDQVATAAMLSEIGRYASVSTQLNSLSEKFKGNKTIKIIEDFIYNNNVRYANREKNIKAVLTKIPEYIFNEYDKTYIPLYSYLLSLKYDLPSVVRRAILCSKENYDNINGPLGVALSVFETQEDKISCKISEIIHMCSVYDYCLYKSKENCAINEISPVFSDVILIMNSLSNKGVIHSGLLKYLYEVLPVYQYGQKVELDDGTVGIVSNTNTLDKTKPVVVDLNGNPIPNDILIVGNYTGDIAEKKVVGL